MSEPTEVWYHGTDAVSYLSILRGGFNHLHNWFASEISVAVRMGGPYVLGVEFDSSKIPVDEDGSRWQMCVHEYIPPQKIIWKEVANAEIESAKKQQLREEWRKWLREDDCTANAEQRIRRALDILDRWNKEVANV